MRNDQVYLSSLGAVLALGFLILAGCTRGATSAPPSSNSQSGSQSAPATTSALHSEASSLSTALNATVDLANDPLAALDLPPLEASDDIEFVTVYMIGGRKLLFATFPRFGEGYLDKNGYVWSKNLRQTANGTYSEAVAACAAIGGILPYGPDYWMVFPTYSADGKTELIAGLSQTAVPLNPPGDHYYSYTSYDGRTARTTNYSLTNSKDVLCIMDYKGRGK